MGACSIKVYATGVNMQDAFREAQRDADEEYGHQQGYSGAINNCDLVKDVTAKYSSFDEEDHFEEWILGQTSKREVYGYCTNKPITNKNKIKTVVHNIPQHGTRKWETRYVARAVNCDYNNFYISERTQTEAIKKARAYVEKHPNATLEINITKELIEGNTKCAQIDYKKASNERKGHYVFVGFAPE
jgi:hypothetical protein